MSDGTRPGALRGLRIVDASRILAGPYAAMLLGDLGASVVKVEQPGRGDDTRSWGPPFTASGVSAYYFGINRSKKGIAIDLSVEPGRRVLHALLDRADVLIENFKPSTREAFGLTAGETGSRYPRLVHAVISGFGATGAFALRPGYDSVVQAASGLMSITGPAEGPPHKVGVAVSDLAAGMQAAVAILAAVRHRDATGRGQFVDVSLFDASLGLLANVASAALVSPDPPRRWGNAHPSIVPYEVVEAKDGPFMLAVGNDSQFRSFCAVAGCDPLAKDPRFATNPARVRHRDALMASLRPVVAGRRVADWLDALESAGVPAGPVRTVPEALACDEAARSGTIVELPEPGGGAQRAVGPVPRFSDTPASVGPVPWRIGEHTDEVLREWLGWEESEIARCRGEGAVA